MQIMNETTIIPSNINEELYPALIQCFFIITVGYIAGQLNLLTQTHSNGLSRYISNFALPAVIFKNLVDVQFASVSWQFLASVFLSKTILFFLTIILTYIAERPRNFAHVGQYAIMTTQSNDFALILPIIEAVYKQSHPEYSRYIYLIAPISLVILNPIGFVLIEIQKRLDDQRRHREKSWHRLQLISAICRNISRNPIVICTLLGILFNQIFRQQLPHLIEYVLTPIAQSFTSTALFYLGLTMVGKLTRLHAHLVITVFLLSMMKLILFPLILRQAVFFLVKPINGSFNQTMDYSNLGFLYGTAPIAPSVIFYVPESNAALQAVASTGLVVSTLLAGPIILFSAKMSSLRTLDIKAKESYELLLKKTGFDVSLLSLLCIMIVLIGFWVRHRRVTVPLIHKCTFICVVLQMILASWTIVMHYLNYPFRSTSSPLLDLGSIFIALTTRTWTTSLSIALMLTMCYSTQLAQRCSWIYHLFGWIVPICISLIIYFCSLINQSKEISILGVERFGKIQLILSIVLLALCVFINTISLLRITRRTYRLKHDNRHVHSPTIEERPLIDEEDQTNAPSVPSESEISLFRPGILVALLTIDAIVCVSVLLWLLFAHNRDGIYYELQFLDTVLLHGQGIITFLVFALDADLLLPISGKIMQFFHRFGLRLTCCRENVTVRSVEIEEPLDFEQKIRPEFLRHSSLTSDAETIFTGSEFCQWLITDNYVENEFRARTYLQECIDNHRILCINQEQNNEDSNPFEQWYAFTK